MENNVKIVEMENKSLFNIIIEEVGRRKFLPKRELVNFLKGKAALSTIYANLNKAVKLGKICEIEAKLVWEYRLIDEISTNKSYFNLLGSSAIYYLYGGKSSKYSKALLEFFSIKSGGLFELYPELIGNEFIIKVRSKRYLENCKAKLMIMPKIEGNLSEFNLVWKPIEEISIDLNMDETAVLSVFKLAWDPHEYEAYKSVEDFILEREKLTPPEERDERYRDWRAFMEMRLKQHYRRMRLSIKPVLTGIFKSEKKGEYSIPFRTALLFLQIYSKEAPPEKRSYVLHRYHEINNKSDKIAAYMGLYEIIDLIKRNN